MNILKKERDQSWLLDADSDVAVPLEITLRDDTLEVLYYPAAGDITDEFLSRFATSEQTLFSKEAAQWAARRFETFLSGYGFSASPDVYDWYVSYTLDTDAARAVPIPSCVKMLEDTHGLCDLTDSDLDGLYNCGYMTFCAVRDGCVAAIANTDEPIGDNTPRFVEIGVDTAEKYRRQGLGRACAAALVCELDRLGYVALYECASENTASLRLAEGLGGKVLYKKYYAVGFRD